MTIPRLCDAALTPATDAALATATLAESRRALKHLPSPQKDLETAGEVEAEAAEGKARVMAAGGAIAKPEAAAAPVAHAIATRVEALCCESMGAPGCLDE
jgi:hypothetical protein